MKFSPAIMQLPWSLLISSLTLAVAALPVESAQLLVLTPENFDNTISQGVWFVEHFSPYCGHCRKFAPTWEKLVEETEQLADPGIHLAQVNCAVHGDLCQKHNIKGYPQMNLYRNGEFAEEYGKSREYEFLAEYLSEHAEPTSPPPSVPQVTETAVPPAIVLQKDEDSYEAPAPSKDVNPNGSVLVLDNSNFYHAVAESPVFVKFFAPWCGHCKKLAPTWTQLAGLMQHRLTIAEVDCEENKALCMAEGVNGYPMLFYYAGSRDTKTEYTSGRKLPQLKAFAEKVSGPAVQELRYDELVAKVAEHPVLYLLLHSPSDPRTMNLVVEASKVLFGSPPLYTSTSSHFFTHFNVEAGQSVILALKDGEATRAAASYILSPNANTKTGKDALVSWLLRHRLPSAMELDSDSFQEVMYASHKPLVVIAATPASQVSSVAQQVRQIAQRWRHQKGDDAVVFTWMDADKWEKWLKSMYGVKAETAPRIVVSNHTRLVYYDVDQFGVPIELSQTSIFSAVNGALSRTIPYKHSENFVERMARYLNGRLIGIESYVTEYPWRVAFFFVVGLVAVFLFLRRFLRDDEEYLRKGRLD
ncbi:thioredoxin-domain-containing protein [Obba rivulosa]|uniref:Thioredoxin-domain-containing protein n=1 Tax=Obba rivulosa TaxID=1052685 RepID=A0A8E2DP87_9APHY|nr:thioredoxin-domain-containing protein [Obba rivulosa]